DVDLHSPKAIEKLIRNHELGLLVTEHPNPSRFGVVYTDAKGNVTEMVEKPEAPKSNLVTIGVYVLDDRIFKYKLVRHERLGEYFLPELFQQLLKEYPMTVEKSDFWHPIGYPKDVESAEMIIRKQGEGNMRENKTPVFIIAGGKGTRMPESEKDKPKVLVEIAGHPMLHWQIEELRKQGFSNITLSLGYRAETVVEWLKKSGNHDIRYVIEPEPLGTGGGLKLAIAGIKEPFLAMNADDIADVNFRALIRHGGDGRWNVLTGFQITDARAFGLLKCDEYKKICSFEEKKPDATDGGLVNIGHYYLLPDVFDGTPDAFSIEHDVFPRLASAGKLLLYDHPGYWLPTGTTEQLAMTREYFAKAH
ncbi:MAG: sugar phosphate nucleotidyltransferase, partial [Patescibacteria group bacterium]